MDQTIRDHFHLLCRLCGRTVLKSIKIRQQNQTNDEATLTEKIYDCIGIQVRVILLFQIIDIHHFNNHYLF